MDHPDHHWFVCLACGKGYPSKLAAEDCADQDDMEADDRAHGRFYGINRFPNDLDDDDTVRSVN